MKIPDLYKKFNVDKDYTSIGLFRALKDKYEIKKVFYPGSYVHITPSLIFADVAYADSFRDTFKFYENIDTLQYIKENKEYPQKPILRFFQQDYTQPFTDLNTEFNLIISQYAGFVGQAVKKYLKAGGILVCNNSHGDASMTSLDSDYEFIAVYQRVSDDKFRISEKDLSSYLIPKRNIQLNKELLLRTMKGIAYTKSPSGYIFRKK